jgi:hypothetical protein
MLRGGDAAPPTFNHGTRWTRVFIFFKTLSLYPWVKATPTHWMWASESPTGSLKLCKWENSPLLLPGIELRFRGHPGCSLVIMPTAPFRLLFSVPAKYYACYITQRSTENRSKHRFHDSKDYAIEQTPDPERTDELSPGNQISFRTIHRDWPPLKWFKQDCVDLSVSPFIRNQSVTFVTFCFCTIHIAPLKSGVAAPVKTRIWNLQLLFTEIHFSALRQQLNHKPGACRATYKRISHKNKKLTFREYLFARLSSNV